MKCPFCNEPMTNGFIRPTGNGGVCWVDRKEGNAVLGPRYAEGFMQLGKAPYFDGYNVSALKCDSCKKIIIDYSTVE